MSTAPLVPEPATDNAAGQYLTFSLADQSYGIALLRVQEIRGFTPITPIPHAPPHLAGVINLRGVVIPVVNLRRRFDLPDAEWTRFTVFIVVDLGTQLAGILVDAVSDVVTIAADQISAPPDLSGHNVPGLVRALARLDDRIVGLLNIDNLLTATEASIATPTGALAR